MVWYLKSWSYTLVPYPHHRQRVALNSNLGVEVQGAALERPRSGISSASDAKVTLPRPEQFARHSQPGMLCDCALYLRRHSSRSLEPHTARTRGWRGLKEGHHHGR
jgi:hypothetical protein